MGRSGNLPQQLGNDPEEITRLVARYLSTPKFRHTASTAAGWLPAVTAMAAFTTTS